LDMESSGRVVAALLVDDVLHLAVAEKLTDGRQAKAKQPPALADG
jgi:hypothetical protein